MEAELGLLEEVHAALARADAAGDAGGKYAALAQAVGGLAAWLRAAAGGPHMRPQGRERFERVWSGAQACAPPQRLGCS